MYDLEMYDLDKKEDREKAKTLSDPQNSEGYSF